MRFSDYPEATPLDGTETVAVNQGGYTRVVPLSRINAPPYSDTGSEAVRQLQVQIISQAATIVALEGTLAQLTATVAALAAGPGGSGTVGNALTDDFGNALTDDFGSMLIED